MLKGRTAKEFNVKSIAKLNDHQREFVRSARPSIVLVFDKDTETKTVTDAVMKTNQKTGVSQFILVSKDATDPANPSYKKASVLPPLWSGDARAEAENHPEGPRAAWEEEFTAEIAKAWNSIDRPVTYKTTITVNVEVTPDMWPGDMLKAATDGVRPAADNKLDEWKRAVLAEQSKREFNVETSHDSLAYKAITANTESAVKAFAYVAGYGGGLEGYKQMVLETANILKVPAGAEFNYQPLVAFPGDDAEKAAEKSAVATRKLAL